MNPKLALCLRASVVKTVRCKTCHYSLLNLTEHRCPECGNAFDPNDPSTMAGSGTSWRRFAFSVACSYAIILLSYALMTYPWLQSRRLSAGMITAYLACGTTMLLLVVVCHLISGDRFARLLLLVIAWMAGAFLFL